ncbi:MAG: hypothetical protein QMD85_03775 [Candidatus Aenigmarchaeota archaeon]|nr:hypothetical protein [Candidatus Aenigmarchaeota archaeon]MDI6722675.1 hypothetical protein [Candidatus Aenigmarchaeota archaeon]
MIDYRGFSVKGVNSSGSAVIITLEKPNYNGNPITKTVSADSFFSDMRRLEEGVDIYKAARNISRQISKATSGEHSNAYSLSDTIPC